MWRRQRSELAFAAIVTAAHLAVAIFAMAHHEMWRDELHCWLVARDSPTPWDVVHNHRYDGHPPLWYLLLWVLTRLTWNPVAMQIMHLAIASAMVFTMARYAPFGRLARALFAFGYFAAYEYAAISRSYGLAFLLVMLLCVHHRRRFERPLVTGLLLATLALTTTVATIVAAAYTASLALEVIAGARRGERPSWRQALPIVMAAIAGLIAMRCAWPPADSTVARVGDLPPLPPSYAPTRLIAGLLPIPRPAFFFWNSNALLAWPPLEHVVLPLAVLLGTWLLFLLSRDRRAATIFAVGAALLMVLFGGVYSGDVRHHGFFFVLFIMCAWLSWDTAPPLDAPTWARVRHAALAPTLVAILVVHVAAAAVALPYETAYVFSSGRRAVDVLRREGLADAPLVAELDYPASAVLGQLGPRAMAYSPRTGRAFSYVQWTHDRTRDPTEQECIRFAASLAATRGRDAALLMTRPLAPALVDGARVTRVADLYDSMIEAENFYIYRVTASAP